MKVQCNAVVPFCLYAFNNINLQLSMIYWFMSGQGSSGPGNNYKVYECLWSMVPCFMIFQIDFWPEKQMFNVCVLLLYVILTSFFAWKFCHKEDTDKKGPQCESQHASWCHLVSSWSFHMIYTSSHSLFSPQNHLLLLLTPYLRHYWLSVVAEVGFSPPRSVNRPFFHLGLLKGRFSSL